MRLKLNFKRFLPLKAIARPAYFCITLVLSICIILKLCAMVKQTKDRVILESHGIRNKTISEIERTALLLSRLKPSSTTLARALSSSLNATQLSFAAIQTKVAPTLFVALSTIPQLSQVSYIGLDGLLFSFYTDGDEDQTFAVYSNTSFSSKWYTQPVNRDTGKPYGDAVASKSMVTLNSNWVQMALNSSSGYSTIGTGWNKDQNSLFLDTVAMDGRGFVSLGFPIKVVSDHFTAIDFHGGYFHLGTEDGKVIALISLPNTQILVSRGKVVVQMLKPNGHLIGHQLSCNSTDDQPQPSPWERVSKFVFHCSNINIAGLKAVYVLAYPRDRLVNLVHRNSTLSLLILALAFIFTISSLCTYMYLTARATKREMFLCAALIRQTEATQQAERKSMNKTKAYAGANHDVRGSLAAITGLIELCQEDAKSGSELASNLSQMENCTKDLLGILNSILDMSKIESGKMTLEAEDFNLAQLLEEVIDMYYPVGHKKGIDLVLDPCDGSIMKSPLVRGDRIKLKQIVCNLVNNAIKFTSEGHVSVRAVVKKNNLKKEIIAFNRTNLWKYLSQFCCKDEDGFNHLDALHNAEENSGEMEFEFEVDDTGKGIPKEKQKSIFEDYVQVKETAAGQEGCGLGLGIVQSLVRIMKGELRIVEKENGERGTCFRFNVFLSKFEGTKPTEAEEQATSTAFQQRFSFKSPKPEGTSHVIIFITGEERRRVVKKYIESLNIKVTIIEDKRNLSLELDRIKQKLDPSYLSSRKPNYSLIDYLNKSSSTNSDAGGASEKPRNSKEGNEYITITPHCRKSTSKNSSSFVLLVIDAKILNCQNEVQDILTNFRKEIPKTMFKVVWLDDQMTHFSRDGQGMQDGAVTLTPEGDYAICKPLHGSRLMQVLSLFPEQKGMNTNNIPSKSTTAKSIQEHPVELNLSSEFCCFEIEPSVGPDQRITIPEISIEKCDEMVGEKSLNGKRGAEVASEKPLNGKRMLVAEDSPVLQKLTTAILVKLGATVEVCENGKEAFDEIRKALNDHTNGGAPMLYDCIIMDCEMPVTDGYEATRLIRAEEERFNVHVPIIALTAHAMPEEASKSIDAGMDFHLTKPLQVDKLLEVFRFIENK